MSATVATAPTKLQLMVRFVGSDMGTMQEATVALTSRGFDSIPPCEFSAAATILTTAGTSTWYVYSVKGSAEF